jgi:hypothetical protein
VADETVDSRVRPGSEFRAHLRDPIELGQTLVATAGTPAHLIVISRERASDGSLRYQIGIIGLNLGLAGELPVKPQTPIVERVAAGMTIPATTLASIGYEQGKVRIAIPLPIKLSNDPPNGGYTPAPLRTAAPILQRRRGRPSPSPSPSASAAPGAAASVAPSPGPPATTPTPLPTPS